MNFRFNSIKFFVALSCLAITFNACKKYDKDNSNINNPKAFSNTVKVTSSFYGTVVDEGGSPMQGVTVAVGNQTYLTDVHGNFMFNDILSYANATNISAYMPGYFRGYKTVKALQGKKHYVKFRMMNMGTPAVVNGLAGGNVFVTGGGKINFSANSLALKANTNSYFTGNVNVYSRRLSPNEVALAELMPGDLRAVNSLGYENLLQTYGMMVVEMFDDAGNAIQIANGKTATITMPIETTAQAQAPNSLPLWHFDEALGLWREEGKAERVGNDYVGAVSHFSFWNCDYPGNLVNFDCTLQDQNGNPLVNYQIVLTQNTNVGAPNGYGWTNNNGYANGSVPQTATVTMQVKDLCGNVIYTTSFTTVTSNISLGTIVIPTTLASNTTVFMGQVVDCFNVPIANAPVNIYINNNYNYTAFTNASGNYFLSANLSCINSSTVSTDYTGFDLANMVSGNTTNLTNVGDTNNVNVTACGNIVQFIQWSDSFAGTTNNYLLVEPSASFTQCGYNTTGQLTTVSGSAPSSYAYFTFTGLDFTPSAHYLQNFYYYNNTSTYNALNAANLPINITSYGTIGNSIMGNFSGALTDSTLNTHYLNFSFKVNRAY